MVRIAEELLYKDLQLVALGASDGARRRDKVRQLLRDRRCHLVYAFEAVRRAGRLGTATPETIQELATRCNVFAPVRNEPITMRHVDKGSGRRWVQDFGPRRRMQQALVAAILRKLHPPLPAQKLFNGGMPKAFTAIETAYRNGLTYGVEVDFIDFYGSIRLDGLAELLRPLPTSVVENVVWDVDAHCDALGAVGDNTTGPHSSASMGLSLGAASSPIVGERIVQRLLAVAQLPDTITYADNLMVLGSSAQEVEARIQTIRDSARQLEVGALELRTGYSVGHSLQRPFEFLKREGIASGEGSDGQIRWSPSQSKLNQYRISETEHTLTVAEIDAVATRIRHWRRSYPNWAEGDVHEAQFLAGLTARRFYVDPNASSLSAAVHAVIVAFVAHGCVVPMDMLIPLEGDGRETKREALLDRTNQWWVDAAGRFPA